MSCRCSTSVEIPHAILAARSAWPTTSHRPRRNRILSKENNLCFIRLPSAVRSSVSMPLSEARHLRFDSETDSTLCTWYICRLLLLIDMQHNVLLTNIVCNCNCRMFRRGRYSSHLFYELSNTCCKLKYFLFVCFYDSLWLLLYNYIQIIQYYCNNEN